MEDTDVGVVTSIDGKNITEITSTNRKKWADSLSDKLLNISEVTDVFIEDANSSYTSIDIAVEISHTVHQSNVMITESLQSITKQIKAVLENDRYASINIVENTVQAPERVQTDIYTNPYYRVTVHYP